METLKQKGAEGVFWLEEGCVIDRQRVLFFTTQGESNVFVREAELKNLELRIQECTTAKTEQENTLKDLLQQRSKLQNERRKRIKGSAKWR